jgi:hypothetical protein
LQLRSGESRAISIRRFSGVPAVQASQLKL